MGMVKIIKPVEWDDYTESPTFFLNSQLPSLLDCIIYTYIHIQRHANIITYCVGGVLCHTLINIIIDFQTFLHVVKVLFMLMLVYLTYDPYQIETVQVCDKFNKYNYDPS